MCMKKLMTRAPRAIFLKGITERHLSRITSKSQPPMEANLHGRRAFMGGVPSLEALPREETVKNPRAPARGSSMEKVRMPRSEERDILAFSRNPTRA
jgi:hypothetical protein